MKKHVDTTSLEAFVVNKFLDMEDSKFRKFKVIAMYIDSLGTLGWSQTADELHDGYSESDNFLTLDKSDFSVFLSNSFIYKWLDAKVIEFQRPVLRQIIMSIKDSKLNAQELRALESFKSLVDSNDTSSNGVIYFYVQTNIKNGDKKVTNALMDKYTKVDE